MDIDRMETLDNTRTSMSMEKRAPIDDKALLRKVTERSLFVTTVVYTSQIDLHVVPCVVAFYLLSFLDRTNIGNARLNGLTEELKLDDYNYRIALTILYVPYILAEVPANLLVKKIGANWFLPSLVTIWGIVATLQGIVVNKEGLWADRFFLGLTEGGILPGIILYLSAWYKPHELQYRIGLFWSASSLAGAFGGLLAAALGLIHTAGLRGWSWIFIIEGIITTLVGIGGFFVMPRNISSCKFLSPEEKAYAYERLLPASGHEEEKEHFSWSEVLSTFKSFHMWLMSIIAFASGIGVYSVAYFLPTIVQTFGKNVWETQLLTVPPYAVSFVGTFSASIWSDKVRKRGPFIIIPQLCAIAGIAILYTCTRDDRGFGPRYFAIFLVVGGIYVAVPSFLAWTSNNFANHYRRATALGVMIVMTNSGGLASTWLFRKNQTPNYTLGYAINMGLLGLGTLIAIYLRFHFKRINASRDAASLSRRSSVDGKLQQSHVEEVPQASRDLGDRGLHFRYTT